MHAYWYHGRAMSKFLIYFLIITMALQVPSVSMGKSKIKGGQKKGRLKQKDPPGKKKVNENPIEPIELPDEFPLTALTRPINNTHQLNSMFGILVSRGSALLTGMQYGHRISKDGSGFLGGEYQFSLYSTGSIFGLLAGGWIEIPIGEKTGPTICIGSMAGSGFTTGLSVPTTVFIGYLDLAFSQPVDDLFDLPFSDFQ